MAILSEPNYLGDVVKAELGENVLYARDKITLITGQNLKVGTVLGQISFGALTSAAKSGGNTGNGVVTLDPTTPVLANARPGIYSVRATVAGTNSATFRVVDPLGVVLGDFAYSGSGAVGSFADRIKFTVTDGSTDFIVGDGFDLTIAAGSAKYTQMALAGLDGSQNAAAVLAVSTDATSADVATVVVARGAVLASNKLIWPGSISAAQLAAGTAQLAALGMIIRTGV